MARKTATITSLVETANRMLAVSDDSPESLGLRWGVIAMIESTLHDAGAYKGYRYLRSELDDEGLLLPEYDTTRRAYSA